MLKHNTKSALYYSTNWAYLCKKKETVVWAEKVRNLLECQIKKLTQRLNYHKVV